MIFALSVGSDGKGPDRFVLYLPFSFAPGRTISSIDPSISHEVIGYELRLEKLVNFYALTVGSFEAESDAKDFFPKLHSSLLWASLKDTVGISFPKSLIDVKLQPGRWNLWVSDGGSYNSFARRNGSGLCRDATMPRDNLVGSSRR